MLYAVGGCDENNLRLHTIERYNPTTDTWTFVPPMSTCRSSPCVIGDKYLYVIGGVSYVGIALNTGERFDPHTNTWSKLPPMGTKRASACGAVVNGKIYIIGKHAYKILFQHPHDSRRFKEQMTSIRTIRTVPKQIMGLNIFLKTLKVPLK